ncbi:4-carboxy-4-hydroxy-2-oxoadipate aldolase/oxaloacetate decarboxylase [Litorivicinus sp.]|jgi:4-hydroxy-4-methyl-2-oxoglutarate aldolase|nr:4-carboxy-4-hydroxy-2-oxoadipate aldolase/oxaloacetate decarboxylase [Litorivicinus sp.]MDB9862636.1 4-carboxy-4-hydroxy-2-oxoadipate aldolase/oxaloacetate decarboxylase [Litorivicinus sp.]MDC1240759.1 4-carboxy-4-hydroxy-2-oxoadipate aldolase/oxaloacetate decarboxylase [Litorivicinus sp.]|tara:strand:- start:1067 stop:1753 length:687 start_codon:yes stop_codon:yes gene_type:complete
MPKVITGIPSISDEIIKRYQGLSVATIHEAQGRVGLLSPEIRPIQDGLKVAGRAVTVFATPGDNVMIHVAMEQCMPGDVMVMAVNSRSDCGYFGDLLATLMQAKGVAGLVIDSGVRDLADLRRMGLPVFSRCISAQGTVKETLGDVNVPIVCGGQLINAGDMVVGDDDGVVVVRRDDLAWVADSSDAREEKEAGIREKYGQGILGLDMNNMRQRLENMGLEYVEYEKE